MKELLRFLVLVTLLMTGNIFLYAVSAYPNRIPICIGGQDTVYIRLYGDEHSKHAESEEGYTIIQDKDCWYYAKKNDKGLLVPSEFPLSKYHDANTLQFLKSTQRHLFPDVVKTSNRISPKKVANNLNSVTGDRRILIILMQYNDLMFTKTLEDFDNLFNKQGYAEDGAQGSVSDFYTDVSYGQLNLICDVVGPFTSSKPYNYYGANDRYGNDSHPEELFEEAIGYAAEVLSLKDYDADDDGFLDNVHIIFAGHGEEAGASANAIWSHEATFWQPYEIQGVKIDRYSCAPELRGNTGNGISRIGPHCHEIGHALGAMDFYDTNYSTGGEYEGTGKWDVMAAGSWNNDGISPADFNPYVKAFNYGWISPSPLPDGEVVLAPSYIDAESYYVLGESEHGDYYLLENRSQEKWGSAVPGSGLLIFHVHGNIENAGNEINSTDPQKCYVVCASSNYKIPSNSPASYGNINSDGCPYPGHSGNSEFSMNSVPSAFFWDNNTCGIELSNIRKEGELILLYNNSIDSGSNDAIRTLLFEDFEGELKVELDNSSLRKWTVVENPAGVQKFPERPKAYSGDKCLQLSAKYQQDYVASMFAFELQDKEESGRMLLTFYATSFNPHAEAANIIKVSYQTEGNSNWQSKEILVSNDNWSQVYVELPANAIPIVKIEGIAFSGSILAIDDIKVEQEIVTDEMSISVKRNIVQPPFSFIYSLTGNRLQQVQCGFNIIMMPDGTYKKIVIK